MSRPDAIDPAPPGGPPIVLATTVAPGDESTSTVLDPDPTTAIALDDDALDEYADIVYALRGSLPLRLDLLLPRDRPPAPLVVYLSGGGFVVSMKEAARANRAHVARSGFAVASVQYRTLSTGGTFLDAIADAQQAIRCLTEHAGEYGIDAGRIGVWGESAGGWLASMVGVTTSPPDAPLVTVEAVIDEFGATDLSRLAEDFDDDARAAHTSPTNPFSAFLGAPGTALRDIPALVRSADPSQLVSGDEPPFLIFHGTRDRLISPSQTLRLHTALLAAGVDSRRYLLRDADHGDMPFLGDPALARVWSTPAVLDVITGFLHAHLDPRADTAQAPARGST
jgi:acetyl esterase/lipase